MEMSWESNRVVLPCTGFHSVRQFSKVQKFYQSGFLLVQQLAQRHGRPSFMVVPEIVCSRGCSAAPLTWGMWFHVYMCRCFWEYRQEYETDTDTESAVWVSYSCLYSWPQVGWTLKNSQRLFLGGVAKHLSEVLLIPTSNSLSLSMAAPVDHHVCLRLLPWQQWNEFLCWNQPCVKFSLCSSCCIISEEERENLTHCVVVWNQVDQQHDNNTQSIISLQQ